MKKEIIITTDLFVKAIRCYKSAFLTATGELENEDADNRDLLENDSLLIEKLHKVVAPHSRLIPDNIGHQEQAALTAEMRKSKSYTIRNATFMKDGAVANIHVLQKDKYVTAWEFVTSSQGIYSSDLWAVSYKYYMMLECGIQVDNYKVIYLDKNAVLLTGTLADQLFKTKLLTPECRRKMFEVEQYLSEIKLSFKIAGGPNTPLGYQCKFPWPCPFTRFCWKSIQKGNVFELRDMKYPNQFRNYQKVDGKFDGIDKTKLSTADKIQVNSTLSGITHITPKKVESVVERVTTALGYQVLDIAFVKPAYPEFKNTSPFSYIPFAFCLSKNVEGTLIYSHQIINIHGKYDTRKELVISLIEAAKTTASPIVCWNGSFIKQRLREVADWFPELEHDIYLLRRRIISLYKLFDERDFYHPQFYGRADHSGVIKAFYPEFPAKGSLRNYHEASRLYFLGKKQSEKEWKISCEDIKEFLAWNTKATHYALKYIADELNKKSYEA